MTIIYCINCGYGGSFEMADKIVERCAYCPRLEAYKGMKLFMVWYAAPEEPDLFVGVYTSEAKANNDGRTFTNQRKKLVSLTRQGKYFVHTVEPNQMASPKVFA